VTEPLVVHLNRGDHRTLDPEEAHHETAGPLVVRLQNHGEGSHVHLSLSGDLATVGTVEDPNPFVAPEQPLEIGVDVDRSHRPLSGGLELSTGYGQESTVVDVELVKNTRSGPETSTTVPEGAGGRTAPQTGGSGGTGGPDVRGLGGVDVRGLGGVDAGTAALLAVAAIAVVAAAAAWQLIDGTAVRLGVLAVLVTALAGAGYGLLRGE